MFNKPLLPTPAVGDPNLFALKWDQVFEVLMGVILFAFLLERLLAPLFESKWYIVMEEKRKFEEKGDYKALIAFLVSVAFCIAWGFDAPSVILSRESITLLGCVITGGVIAGGSKGSIKLFRDVLGVYSTSYAEAKGLPTPGKPAPTTTKTVTVVAKETETKTPEGKEIKPVETGTTEDKKKAGE